MAKSQEAENENSPFAVESAPEQLDVGSILALVGETAYDWDLHTDNIIWQPNACNVMGVSDMEPLRDGAVFRERIVPEHRARHTQALADSGCAIDERRNDYLIHYRFNTNGSRCSTQTWIEDRGQVSRNAVGNGLRARGVLRVIAEDNLHAEQRPFGGDFDELTGQISRLRLMEALEDMLARTRRTNKPSGFLMAAITNLSVVNENFGFEVGDEVISAVAKSMRGTIRSGDTLGRYSANKFGIILADCGPGAIRIAAERLLSAIRNTTIDTSKCPLSVTLSIGGVVFPDQAGDVGHIVGCALQALETSKHGNHDCFVAYQPCDQRKNKRARNAAIAENVAQALADNKMRLVLQPLVGAKSGKAEIHECLLRMEGPNGILVSAGEFIEVAEQIGLWRMIDHRTLHLAVALLKEHEDLKLALNVSSLTASDHSWLVKLHQLTGGSRALTNRMIVEITETAAISNLNQTMAFCDLLNEIGCRVAIDDFGAGYTSFKNLKHLNVDMVKIDGSFVENLPRDPANRIFIKTMLELAENFGMETVAEWVGDEETAKLLKESGVTYLQGFHFGQPIDARTLATNAGPKRASA